MGTRDDYISACERLDKLDINPKKKQTIGEIIDYSMISGEKPPDLAKLSQLTQDQLEKMEKKYLERASPHFKLVKFE